MKRTKFIYIKSFIEQILEATSHKTEAFRPPTSHL